MPFLFSTEIAFLKSLPKSAMRERREMDQNFGLQRWLRAFSLTTTCSETLYVNFHCVFMSMFSFQTPNLDEMSLKKMLLNFEKKVYKNQEQRIKYPDLPEK